MINLYSKLRPGAHAFVMVADYDKYNQVIEQKEAYSIGGLPAHPVNILSKEEHQEPSAERWYHIGISGACSILEQIGYQVVERDAGVNHRDPVIHFIKPVA